MKAEMNRNKVMTFIKGLSKAEQSSLVDELMRMMATSNLAKADVRKERNLCRDLGSGGTGEKPDCPHCAAKASLGYIIKRGLNKGAQRYYCKSCGRYFLATTTLRFEMG